MACFYLQVCPWYAPLLSLHRSRNTTGYNLPSSDSYLLSVSKVRIELGKKAFSYSAPSTCNTLQSDLQLRKISFGEFKSRMKD